jgi:hypothetical protein
VTGTKLLILFKKIFCTYAVNVHVSMCQMCDGVMADTSGH